MPCGLLLCTNPLTVIASSLGLYKKVLVSGREAPENLTRSVGLFFFILDYFFLFFAVH